MASRIGLSMDFWSDARAEVGFFAYDVSVRAVERAESQHTSGFSPCLKKASSLFSDLDLFSRTKYSGLETLSNVEPSTPLRSTLVDVAMTYREFTLLSGTPLILNGPVTRSVPWSSCLRRTTRLPRNRPARRMRTAPGWRDSRYFVGLMDFRVCTRC